MNLKYIIEILRKKYFIEYVEIFDGKNNELIIEKIDVDEFVIDEIFDELNIEFEIIRNDEYNIFIKIDDDEFIVKNSIDTIKDLIKFNVENELYNEFVEINNVADDDLYKFYIDNKSFFKYDIADDDELSTGLLFSNLYKVFENTIDKKDIEFYIDINEFINNIGSNYISNYITYDVEIDNENYIIVDNKHKIIKNINHDEIVEIATNLIDKSIELSEKINYDKIIDIFNIIKKYDEKIIADENEIDDIIFVDDTVENYINNYDKGIEFIYINNIVTSQATTTISNISYENINDVFDENVVDDLIDYLSSNYYFNYDEFNNLNKILDTQE